MSHPAPQGDGRISRVHNMALCTEIGERLGASLDDMPAEVPEHLRLLMARFRDETAAVQADPGA
jgi:hypothetical protein